MKYFIWCTLFLLWGACMQTSTQQETTSTADTDNPNDILYDQLMELHDSVMLRSDELYTLKTSLLKDLEEHPDRKELVTPVVAQLDSAYDAMMDWMRKFSMPDGKDSEGVRVYLENEMERMKKIQELTDESLLNARAINPEEN